MTAPTPESQVQEQKSNDKELNFRALESKYQRELEKERAARLEAERLAQDALTRKNEIAERKAQEKDREYWLKNNPDFYEVLQNAEKFAQKDPELAESILEMPDTFARQKLVYKNIKALGLHRPEVKAPSIQEKIDANRKSPYYQPSGVGSAPYQSVGDFSTGGQKQAYDKMQELKNRLRI